MIEKRTAIEQLRALLNPWKRAIDDAERAIDVDGSDVGTYPEGWDSEIVCLDIEASTCAIIAYAESLRDDGLIEFIKDIAQPAPNAGDPRQGVWRVEEKARQLISAASSNDKDAIQLVLCSLFEIANVEDPFVALDTLSSFLLGGSGADGIKGRLMEFRDAPANRCESQSNQ